MISPNQPLERDAALLDSALNPIAIANPLYRINRAEQDWVRSKFSVYDSS